MFLVPPPNLLGTNFCTRERRGKALLLLRPYPPPEYAGTKNRTRVG